VNDSALGGVRENIGQAHANGSDHPRLNLRVLVTGGAGFIGSELVRQLLAASAEVTVVDNLVNGRRENLADLPTERCSLVVADIRNTDAMSQLMMGVDVVFHLACLGVRHSLHSPLENHEVNATATLGMLRLARSIDVPRFVYVSSSEVFGLTHEVPISEEHPMRPLTVYGASKLAGECYTQAYFKTYGYSTVVVRPFNTYGPRCHHEGDSGEVIPKFMLRAMAGRPMVIFGDGTQTRDFTFVSDTARGILLAGLAHDAVGRSINIGSGHEISITQLAREVAMVVNRPDAEVVHDDPRPGDVYRLCANIARARELLAFEPRISLREGISRVRDWYASLGQTPEKLLEQEIVRNWELAPSTVALGLSPSR
jgi:UDP-glucose 4-epimerase